MSFTSVDNGYLNVFIVYIIPIDIYLVNEKYYIYYLKIEGKKQLDAAVFASVSLRLRSAFFMLFWKGRTRGSCRLLF